MKSNIQEIKIPTSAGEVAGLLREPDNAKAMIVFAHGSGSGRLSPRNQAIADYLHEYRYATLLFDLLTEQEEQIDNDTREFRFNIPLLAERLITVTRWVHEHYPHYPIGYFGASTGAGAALLAAATIDEEIKPNIKTVVSRSGRADLAGEALANVSAPTLLIVGGEDRTVIELNQMALQELNCEKSLIIVPGATHLYDEPGKLEEVMVISREWFDEHFI